MSDVHSFEISLQGMANVITVYGIDKKFETLKVPVRKQVQEILLALKKDGVAIDVLLLGNRKMRALNKRYREKDSATNVLSFEEPKQFIYPHEVLSQPKGKGAQRKGLVLSQPKGEIYLNPEMASDWWIGKSKKKAEEFLDIRFLLIHGVLHLFGYDHIEDDDAKTMERKEVMLMKLLRK